MRDLSGAAQRDCGTCNAKIAMIAAVSCNSRASPALMDGLGVRDAAVHQCRSYLQGDSQLLMILVR